MEARCADVGTPTSSRHDTTSSARDARRRIGCGFLFLWVLVALPVRGQLPIPGATPSDAQNGSVNGASTVPVAPVSAELRARLHSPRATFLS